MVLFYSHNFYFSHLWAWQLIGLFIKRCDIFTFTEDVKHNPWPQPYVAAGIDNNLFCIYRNYSACPGFWIK